MYTGIGVLRLGFIVRFLSHSVITGFTSGAAILIALGQVGVHAALLPSASAAEGSALRAWARLPQRCIAAAAAAQVRYILGYKVPRAETLHEILHNLIAGGKGFKWQEFVMVRRLPAAPGRPQQRAAAGPSQLRTCGAHAHRLRRCACVAAALPQGMSMLMLLFALRILSKRVKKLKWMAAMGPIICCIISIAAVAIGKLNTRGIKIVEKIPQGAAAAAAAAVSAVAGATTA